MPDLILSEDHGAVRLLTMNRHDKMNAFNGALSSALIEALGLASDEASVAAVVLTGGPRAFSAGAVTIGIPLHVDIPRDYVHEIWDSLDGKSLEDLEASWVRHHGGRP